LSQSVKLFGVQGKKYYAQLIENELGFSTAHAICEASLAGAVWLSSKLGQSRGSSEKNSMRVETAQWYLGEWSFFWANRHDSTHRLEFK
jgi:hypothetical protein